MYFLLKHARNIININFSEKFKFFIVSSFAQYASILVGLAGLIITMLKFGVHARGEYAVAYSFVSIFGIFFGWSLGRSVVYYLPNSGLTSKEFFSQSLFTIATMLFILILLASICFAFMLRYFPQAKGDVSTLYLFIMFFSLPHAMWQYSGRFFYAQISKIEIQCMLIIGTRLLLLILLFVLIYYCNYSLLFLFIIFSTVNLLTFIIELAVLGYFVKPKWKIDRKLLLSLIFKGGLVHLDSVLGYFLFSANVIFVNYMLGIEKAAIYSLVIQFHSLLFILPTTGLMFMQKEIGINKLQNLKKDFTYYFSLCIVFIVISIPLVYFAIQGIFLFDNNYDKRNAAEVFNLFLLIIPALICMCATQLLNPVLVYLDKVKKLLRTTFWVSAMNILLLLLGLKYWGLLGSIFSVTITQVFILIAYIRLIKIRNNDVNLIKG